MTATETAPEGATVPPVPSSPAAPLVLPTAVTDAVVVAVARQLYGPQFTLAEKATVRRTLDAGIAAGYRLVFEDRPPRPPAEVPWQENAA